jgi:predicted GIY-YIG superfamily endonuclease
MSTPDHTPESAKVYIYVLQRISDKAYLYIGSARNPQRRFREHGLSTPYPAIRSAFAENDIRYLVITETDEAHRIEVEARLWRQYKAAGHPIVNHNPARAWHNHQFRIVSEETRRKMSQSAKGNKRSKGTCQSEEVRLKHSIANKGKEPPNKNRPMSELQKLKISQASKGKRRGPLDEKTRRKMSESAKGKVRTEEHCRNLSKANKGRVRSEQARQRMSESHKGIQLSEEHKRNIAQSNKGHIVTEETRRKISASLMGHSVSESTKVKISRKLKGDNS